MSTDSLLLLHAAVTLFMTGLIWFVQVVHYPLLLEVGRGHFQTYSRANQQRTTFVVAPVMLLELATAVGLVAGLTAGAGRIAAWLGLGLLAAIWLSTAWIQVPLHRRLLSGFDRHTISRLVSGNWLRTIAWTLRSGIALWLLRVAWGVTAAPAR